MKIEVGADPPFYDKNASRTDIHLSEPVIKKYSAKELIEKLEQEKGIVLDPKSNIGYVRQVALANDLDIEYEKINKRKLKKEELQSALTEIGVTATGNLAALQKLSIDNDLPISVIEERIKEGFENKEKGMLDVLGDRGWVDTNQRTSVLILTNQKKTKMEGIFLELAL